MRRPGYRERLDYDRLMFELTPHVASIQRELHFLRGPAMVTPKAIVLPARYEPLTKQGMTLLSLPVVSADVEKIGILVEVD